MTVRVTSLVAPSTDHLAIALVAHLRAQAVDADWLDGSWDHRFRAVEAGEVAVAWVCGLLHARTDVAGSWTATAVAALPSRRPDALGRPAYFGDIVVATGSAFATVADLAGTRFAFNEVMSLSGYRMMLDRLADEETDLDFFASSTATGSHAASMAAVLGGRADCAMIDSTILDDRPQPGLRVIESVGPYPAPPFIVMDGADPTVSEHVRSHPGLVDVSDDLYDDLRAVASGTGSPAR